jgi:hypothetical protein
LEQLILIIGIVAVGLVAAAGAIAWPLYAKPRLRRRYERTHYRNKMAADRNPTR